MPRIRNWKDLILFRPHKGATYRHINDLFGEAIDWKLIENHWQDLMQIVLSIQAGKLLPSDLLRKLGHESRKNRLYQAFRELGRVIRTLFLLRYISDLPLRRQISETENKIEAYHGLWQRFVQKTATWLNNVLTVITPTADVVSDTCRKTIKNIGSKVGQRLNLNVFGKNLNALG